MSVLDWIKLGVAIGPEVRDGIKAIIAALKGNDDVAARRAVEATRRALFVARQK